MKTILNTKKLTVVAIVLGVKVRVHCCPVKYDMLFKLFSVFKILLNPM